MQYRWFFLGMPIILIGSISCKNAAQENNDSELDSVDIRESYNDFKELAGSSSTYIRFFVANTSANLKKIANLSINKNAVPCAAYNPIKIPNIGYCSFSDLNDGDTNINSDITFNDGLSYFIAVQVFSGAKGNLKLLAGTNFKVVDSGSNCGYVEIDFYNDSSELELGICKADADGKVSSNEAIEDL